MGSLHRLLLSAVFIMLSMIPVGCPGKGTAPKMTLTISPSGSVGVPVGEVQFSVDSSDPLVIESYSWTFGDGATPNTSTDATPTVLLNDPGTHTVSLSIVDDQFQTHLASGEFTVTTPEAPTWTVQELGPCIGGDAANPNSPGTSVTGLILDGRVVLAYTAPDGLTIRRAQVEEPSATEDWTEHIIDPDGFLAGVNSLTVHKGRLALLYQRNLSTDPAFCLAWADTEEPTSVEDWQIHEILPYGWSGPASLASINDEYLLATSHGSDLPMFVSSEAPESSEDWTAYRVESPYSEYSTEFGPSTGIVGRILERDGNIVTVASTGLPDVPTGVVFYHTIVSPPLAKEDWMGKAITNAKLSGRASFISSVDLWPHATGWGMVAGDGISDELIIASTSNPDPAVEDWTKFRLEGEQIAAFTPSGGVVAGRAVVAYFDNTNQRLRIARQVTTSIDLPQDWQLSTVTSVVGDPYYKIWGEPLILEIDGRIAIFWTEYFSKRLRYALADSAY